MAPAACTTADSWPPPPPALPPASEPPGVSPAEPPLLHPRATAGLAHQGYFNPEALFWREGQPEWKPLRELPELSALLEAAAAAAAAAATGDGGEAEGEQEAPQPRKAGACQGCSRCQAAAGWRSFRGVVQAVLPHMLQRLGNTV